MGLESLATACRRSKTDLFVFDLAVKWPGVRHMLALDQAQAVEHVVTLTYGLGLQPYKAQVSMQLVSVCLSSSQLDFQLAAKGGFAIHEEVNPSTGVGLQPDTCCTQSAGMAEILEHKPLVNRFQKRRLYTSITL